MASWPMFGLCDLSKLEYLPNSVEYNHQSGLILVDVNKMWLYLKERSKMLQLITKIISGSVLYCILIWALVESWMTLKDEQSAFEETIKENERKLPSFTLCQKKYGGNKPIETFKDAATEIENFRSKFEIKYYDYDFNLEKSNPKEEDHKNPLDSNWKFVPKFNIGSPKEDAICLIWTPSKERRPEKTVQVCIMYFYFKVKRK